MAIATATIPALTVPTLPTATLLGIRVKPPAVVPSGSPLVLNAKSPILLGLAGLERSRISTTEPATTNRRSLMGSKAGISPPLLLVKPPILVKRLEPLLVIAIFWVVVVPRAIPEDGVLRLNAAVSVPSAIPSSVATKVAVAVV